MAIKVMLIEDEAGMRLLLRKAIEKHPQFRVVAECEDFASAIMEFRRQEPEVVFLDIGIRGENGIECARILADLDPKLKIVFATAHEEYRSEAFELYAFDYLVKPFDINRLNRTLDRLVSISNREVPETGDCIVASGHRQDKLLVKGKESMSFIHIPDIVLIQRENGSSVIYTETDRFVTSASLTELEKKLDPEEFLRSHKSYIINLSRITKIEPYGRWTYVVHFQGRKEDALLTAERFEKIRRRFS